MIAGPATGQVDHLDGLGYPPRATSRSGGISASQATIELFERVAVSEKKHELASKEIDSLRLRIADLETRVALAGKGGALSRLRSLFGGHR